MWVALIDTGIGNTRKLGIVELVDVGSSAVAHAGAETTSELLDNLLNGALVRHATSNTLGH